MKLKPISMLGFLCGCVSVNLFLVLYFQLKSNTVDELSRNKRWNRSKFYRYRKTVETTKRGSSDNVKLRSGLEKYRKG